MSAIQFIEGLTQVLYLLIAIVVTIAAVRRPTRVRVDTALFFGTITLIIAEGWIFRTLGISTGRLSGVLTSSLLMALPYLLLRLVNDFTAVPAWHMRATETGLLLAVAALAALSPPLPFGLTLLLVLYFIAVSSYVARAFLRAARRAGGVTRRRMQSIAFGTDTLGLMILLAGLSALLPPASQQALAMVMQPISLISGLSYVIGFATPPLLRRAWQEPELRAFLARAASLPRLPDTAAIVRELERGAIEALGHQPPRSACGMRRAAHWSTPAPTARKPMTPPP